jgi:hypothetical protein
MNLCAKETIDISLQEIQLKIAEFQSKHEQKASEIKSKIDQIKIDINEKAKELIQQIIDQQNILLNDTQSIETNVNNKLNKLLKKHYITSKKFEVLKYHYNSDSNPNLDQNVCVKIKFELEQIKFDMNCFQFKELNQIDLNLEFKTNNLIQNNICIGKLVERENSISQSVAPVVLNSTATDSISLINIKTDKELDKDVWESMKNEATLTHIKINEMTPSQLDVYFYLNDLMKQVISTKFGKNTRSNLIRKTLSGYTVRRFCYFNNCLSAWILNVKVPSGIGI